LIEAIKKAEEVHLHQARIIPKAARKRGTETDTESANFEFKRDKPTGLPYIYIVMGKGLVDSIEEHWEDVLSTFVTLEDANNFVRNHCADNAERDDPDAIFGEGMSADGRISWCYEDENGNGTELRIEKCMINAPGSVPARDWSRPIGAPCPVKEDSEDENECSSSGNDEYRGYEKEIEFRTHRY
jgi:hypothetical protein